jgi:propionyl-CoA carboxylase alpha chain
MTFPLLLKPAAGGGGRGMRIVNKEEDLVPAFKACQEEAIKGFSDDRLFLEQYIPKPRHIEFQVLADHQGKVIHLGERECSIQRRYQKVLEESPSLALDSSLRAKMGGLACDLACEAGYVNAGTVEFILDPFKNIYFLEMNTRLQVEHPVTEMVTGLDLVELQLRIAAGEHLPLAQEDVSLNGWAIEARICAENPIRDFFPTTGIVARYAAPRGKGVRVDDGIAAGSVVTAHYDSMLSKVITLGKDRDEAIKKMVRALNGYHIEGLTTNVDFVNAVVDHPAFSAGELSTDFIAEHFLDGQAKISPDQEKMDYMVIAAVLVYHNRQDLVRQSLAPMSPIVGRKAGLKKMPSYMVKVGEDVFSVFLDGDPKDHHWHIKVEERPYHVVTPEFEFYRRRLKLLIDETSHMFRLSYDENHIRVSFCGVVRLLEIYSPLEWRLSKYMLRSRTEKEENELTCPMPGLVIGVTVKIGDYVRKGQEAFMIESMKMQSSIISPRDGQVESVFVTVGQTVETDQVLMKFKA